MEPVDERSERIAQRFQWPMIVVALLVIPALFLAESHPERTGDPPSSGLDGPS